eukprot:scaffold32662_cov101-Isochrysis_galbana.AAC.2
MVTPFALGQTAHRTCAMRVRSSSTPSVNRMSATPSCASASVWITSLMSEAPCGPAAMPEMRYPSSSGWPRRAAAIPPATVEQTTTTISDTRDASPCMVVSRSCGAAPDVGGVEGVASAGGRGWARLWAVWMVQGGVPASRDIWRGMARGMAVRAAGQAVGGLGVGHGGETRRGRRRGGVAGRQAAERYIVRNREDGEAGGPVGLFRLGVGRQCHRHRVQRLRPRHNHPTGEVVQQRRKVLGRARHHCARHRAALGMGVLLGAVGAEHVGQERAQRHGQAERLRHLARHGRCGRADGIHQRQRRRRLCQQPLLEVRRAQPEQQADVAERDVAGAPRPDLTQPGG